MTTTTNNRSIVRTFFDWLTSFFSVEGKMRANAHNWLELADKIYHFRRDQLADKDLLELQQKRENLRSLVRDRVDAGKLKLGVEALEGVMRRTGGKIYPKSTVQEYVEFFLVAAIVVIGVKAYFVQPFKIPTNSMWPSYNGMTPKVYLSHADEPGYLKQMLRLVTLGAAAHRIDAPADGEIMIQVSGSVSRLVLPYREVPGRAWLFFPTKLKEYTVIVGDEAVAVRVPLDFDFEWLIRDTFFQNKSPSYEPSGVDLARAYAAQREKINDGHYQLLRTGKRVSRGERVLSFDIMTGDQLFVDRISYHFVRPKTGDGFVFRTGHISSIGSDQYYIKRLVGVPGDSIEIREPVLYRNGKPVTGATAFDRNAHREGQYSGYFNGRPDERYPSAQLFAGQTITVPREGFLALGDNSGNSLDGRYWGFVPRKDVVGRPIFVYYPFSNHWGAAR